MEVGNFDPKEILKIQIQQHSDPKKRAITGKRNKLRGRDISFIKKYFPEAKSVLSIGSRDDAEVQHFINSGFNSVGTDISNETSLIMKCDAHNLNRYKFFKDKKFDIVYASHVLEHMTDSNKVMKNIRNIANMGVVILLPLSSKGPREKHPTIFDIMKVSTEDKHIFSKPQKYESIWIDFEPLQPFDIMYGEFRTGINEREVMICLKFKN